MPSFTFHRCADARRSQIAAAELSDGEAARMYAVDLAGQLLDQATGPEAECRMIICDAEGRDLDIVISERF